MFGYILNFNCESRKNYFYSFIVSCVIEILKGEQEVNNKNNFILSIEVLYNNIECAHKIINAFFRGHFTEFFY